ncbi:MAG: hypothetical protein JWM11_5954 [Planctomycetaceae bacterium]|nr:hypothetical protein [Planctomycetaceae bacterium]
MEGDGWQITPRMTGISFGWANLQQSDVESNMLDENALSLRSRRISIPVSWFPKAVRHVIISASEFLGVWNLERLDPNFKPLPKLIA